jgi:hypothetical protein
MDMPPTTGRIVLAKLDADEMAPYCASDYKHIPDEVETLLVTPSSFRKMPLRGLSVLSEKEELELKKMIIENANSLYEFGIALTALRERCLS